MISHIPRISCDHLLLLENRVHDALEWLRENNLLYQQIVNNHDELDGWANEFIPTGIVDNILQCAANHTEKKRYAVDSEMNNHDDDFEAAMTRAELAR